MTTAHSFELLPFSHVYDPSLQKLTIPDLDSFPPEVLELAEDIEILDLSHGHLKSLPNDFGRLHKLRVLFMSHNDFTELPPVLATCPELQTIGAASCKISTITELPQNLEALILTNNHLSELPASLGELIHLRKLTLTGNRLSALPHELLNCTDLELIRLAANTFTAPPEWLFDLPNLAWYADASNPYSPPARHIPPTIDWSEVILGIKLGESSKNTVHAAALRSSNQEVAVKVFGNQISADGHSADEIKAHLHIPAHPALIRTIAQVHSAPDNKKRLVMARIADDYVSLGNPPTLQTVTRDTYDPTVTFTFLFILQVLRDIASALQHLHRAGLMHGDVYAHNILVNEQGRAILADLGAASFYESSHSSPRELIEVKAFGRLMDELLARYQPTSQDDTSACTLLEALCAKCLLSIPTDRPTFSEISTVLDAIHAQNS